MEFIAKVRFEACDQLFIKEKSLEALVLLSIVDKVSRYKALALLEELESDWPPYLLIKAIKLLGHLYDKHPEDGILEIMKRGLSSYDPQVLSEVVYHLGIIHLRKALESTDNKNLISELQEAHKWFTQADSILENRDDARFYKLVAKLFINLLGATRYDEDILNQLEEIISKRRLFSCDDCQEVVLETKIFELFQNLKLVFEKIDCIDSWLNISTEILELANIYSIERHISFKGTFLQEFDDSIKKFVFLPRVKTSVYHKISAAKQRLELIRKQYLPSFSEQQLQFVDAILDYCMSNPDPVKTKKKELRDKALVKLSIATNIPPQEIAEQLDRSLEEDRFEEYLIDKVGFLGQLLLERNEFQFETGFPIGDEILKDFREKVRFLLPEYPEKKLKAYLAILSELIRYNIHVNDVQKNDRGRDRSFLFSEEAGGHGQNASEKDLQQDVFDFLLGTRIANFLELEKTNVASGRVDIRVNFGEIRFPIEIKKELRDVSEDHIKSAYIAQAQTYAASYDQLGFFMVLDLTEKAKQQPPVNIRDHFYLTHLKPQENITVRYPDYITVILVTGNRLTPSLRSKYSR